MMTKKLQRRVEEKLIETLEEDYMRESPKSKQWRTYTTIYEHKVERSSNIDTMITHKTEIVDKATGKTTITTTITNTLPKTIITSNVKPYR
jgi:hypothetical protein